MSPWSVPPLLRPSESFLFPLSRGNPLNGRSRGMGGGGGGRAAFLTPAAAAVRRRMYSTVGLREGANAAHRSSFGRRTCWEAPFHRGRAPNPTDQRATKSEPKLAKKGYAQKSCSIAHTIGVSQTKMLENRWKAKHVSPLARIFFPRTF